MERLVPSVPVTVPLASLQHPAEEMFQSAGGESSPFTTQGLLKACEHAGYFEAQQPSAVAPHIQMMPYQLQTLQWMCDMESLEGGLNSLFWEERRWPDGGAYFYAPQLGELRVERPPVTRGGLLCEEMGLGKTLEIEALVLATLNDSLEPLRFPSKCIVNSKATLIVVPPALVPQWREEILKTTKAGALSVTTYVSAQERITETGTVRKRRVEALAAHAIVLTTYSILEKDPILELIHWKRIALDEMQEVRSSTTQLAKKCERMPASFRWMISGTPIFRDVNDLNGELHFLGVWPFALRDEVDGFWGRKIQAPWDMQEPLALDLLHTLLRGVMIRHSKSQSYKDGRPILSLPARRTHIVPVDIEGSHAAVIAYIEALGARLLSSGRMSDDGREAKDKRRQLLNLLCQACISPTLVNGGMGVKNMLMPVNNLIRLEDERRGANGAVPQGGGAHEADGGGIWRDVKRMTIEDALKVPLIPPCGRIGWMSLCSFSTACSTSIARPRAIW
jgi:SNF2 family DNA or RNA helicase